MPKKKRSCLNLERVLDIVEKFDFKHLLKSQNRVFLIYFFLTTVSKL